MGAGRRAGGRRAGRPAGARGGTCQRSWDPCPWERGQAVRVLEQRQRGEGGVRSRTPLAPRRYNSEVWGAETDGDCRALGPRAPLPG